MATASRSTEARGARPCADRRCSCTAATVPIPTSHLGYDYLQKQLARMGIIAVSVDCHEIRWMEQLR